MELELKNLTKRFRDMTAVDHVTYTMTNGVYGLLGVNGAGKTTLMRMLCTLLSPTEGEVCWNGRDIFAMGAITAGFLDTCLRISGIIRISRSTTI